MPLRVVLPEPRTVSVEAAVLEMFPVMVSEPPEMLLTSRRLAPSESAVAALSSMLLVPLKIAGSPPRVIAVEIALLCRPGPRRH